MKHSLIILLAFFIIVLLSFQLVLAQFPIKTPKLPKTEKPKQEQPKTNDNGNNLPKDRTINQSQSPKTGSDNTYKNQRLTNVPVLLENTIYMQTKKHTE